MKVSIRKLVVVLLAGFILLPLAAYWLADYWLESSGGRRLLEQTLSGRIGMNVHLAGDFELMLLPSIGVSGTELVIGGPGPGSGKRDSLFARSHEFEISIALRPLLDRRLLIEWIRLSGGSIYPERYSRTTQTAGAEPFAKSLLPEIQELSIRDFQIVLPTEDENEDESFLQVSELTVTNFAENRETPFTLEIEDLAAAKGRMRWEASESLVHIGELQLDLGGQVVTGKGCLFLQSPVSLHFDLQAGAFDLDTFQENLPDIGADTGAGNGSPPLEIRGRFTVDELKTSGAVARGVVLRLGDEPACD
jgi:uncharacterized protein involved in outer membrane biogenesis